MKENNEHIEESLPEQNTSVPPPTPRKGKKLLVSLLILLIIVILSAGSFFWYKKNNAPVVPPQSTQLENENLFYKLDDIIVNLNTNESQSRFLKVGITLQINNKDTISKLENSLPIIKDLIQAYLRELRPQDLNGSAGLYRIKDELLLRLNEVIAPNKIIDVLFRDILVQ